MGPKRKSGNRSRCPRSWPRSAGRAPERAALQLGDGELQFVLKQQAGSEDLVVSQQIAVELGPCYEIALLVVVRDQGNFFINSWDCHYIRAV